MRRLLLPIVILAMTTLTAGYGSAREIVATGLLDGKPIITYSDGLWRPDDSAGEVCSAIKPVLKLCALPSQWSPFPIMEKYHRNLFWNDQGYDSEVFVLEDLSGALISEKSVLRVIGDYARQGNGLLGLQIDKADTEMLGVPAKTLVFQTAGVSAYTYANVGKRWIVAETRQLGTTLYLDDHKKIHSEFLTMLRTGD